MAVVGGTASVLGGGKFGNGAMAGAFMQMFNAEARSYIKSLNARQILQVDKFRQYVENMDLKTFNKTFNLYLTSDSEMCIYKADIYKQLDPAIIRGAYNMTQQAIKDIGGTRSLSAPIKAVYHLFGPGGKIGYDFIEGTTTLRGIYEIH